MLILVSYDIPDDRRRTKLAKALKDFGERVQYSVFECHLTEPQVARLRTRIQRLTDETEDSVRLYLLCGHCRDRVEVHGLGLPPQDDPEVYIL